MLTLDLFRIFSDLLRLHNRRRKNPFYYQLKISLDLSTPFRPLLWKFFSMKAKTWNGSKGAKCSINRLAIRHPCNCSCWTFSWLFSVSTTYGASSTYDALSEKQLSDVSLFYFLLNADFGSLPYKITEGGLSCLYPEQ